MTRKGYSAEYKCKKELMKQYGPRNVFKIAIGGAMDYFVVSKGKLIKTIDKTIEHLKGVNKMKEKEMFSGFSKEKQAEYEKEIIERFGEQGKAHIEESKQNAKK